MRNRRIIIFFFIGVLLLPIMMGMLKPGRSVASEADGGLTYVEGDGQITIMGYEGTEDSVLVPSEIKGKPVVAIGDKAFEDSEIHEIILPEGIKSIGYAAFRRCGNLKKIEIPHSVDTIGMVAFYNCKSLSKISIHNGVTTIEANTFSYCTSLETISIPSSVLDIGSEAFKNCSSLKVIELPDSIEEIKYSTFEGCQSLGQISIPSGMISIGNRAFKGCFHLSEISLPDSIKSIGTEAFNNCRNLTEVRIPEGITKIEVGTFNTCMKLSRIFIPGSVICIGTDAFKTVGDDFTIIGYRGSFAEEYAGENDLPFRSLINEVSFDSRGGTDIEEIAVEYGATITEPSTPTKPGYQFLGWYRDREGHHPWDFDMDMVIEDTLLYGKWASSYITVPSVQLKMGTTIDSPCTTLRFIAGIHSIENLEEAGFVISLENANPTMGEEDCTKYSTDTVYRSILAGGEAVSGDFLGGEYILTLTSQEIPRDAYAHEIFVRPYVLLEDGSVSYGDVGTFTVEACIQGQGGEENE